MRTLEQLEREGDSPSGVSRPSTGGQRRQSSRIILFIVVAILLITLYFGAGLLLTRQVGARYAAGDCPSLLQLVQPAERFYPAQLVPFTKPGLSQAEECQDYLETAALAEGAGWSAAYDGYQSYLTKYPHGQFVTEAREGAAEALLGRAKELQHSGDYSQAINHVLVVLRDYADTAAKPEAEKLLPAVYLEWANRLREQRDYANAWEKYQKTIEADPHPRPADGAGAQAQAALPALYREWGEALLRDGSYSQAIEQIKNGITVARPQDIPAMQDALSMAYLRWAVSLRNAGEFLAALEKSEIAANRAASMAANAEAERTRAETLTAFSRSQGSEARQLMDETVKNICLDGKTAQSPIIAVDPGSIRAYPLLADLSGGANRSDLALSEQVAARTPASFHYALCLQGDTRRIETCTYTGGYFIERWRYYWEAQLRNVRTGQVLKKTEIGGTAPAACPLSHMFTASVFVEKFFGGGPQESSLDAWLTGALRRAPAATAGTQAPARLAGEAPVLDGAQLRYDNSSGKMVVFQDLSFHDPDGDASTVHYELVSATSTGLAVSDGQLALTAEQQKQGATITGQWVCAGQYEVIIRVTIVDQAGNVSNAEVYTMYCR